MKEDVLFGLAFTFLALVVVGGLLLLSAFFNNWSCSSRWSGTYQTEYGIMSGCRVKVDNKWMPERNLRQL